MKTGRNATARATKRRRVQRHVQRSARDRVVSPRTHHASSGASTEALSRAPLHTDSRPDLPSAEPGNDGRIRAALDAVLSAPVRDPQSGQFVRGIVRTGADSQLFWSTLAPIKADIVGRVRAQLAVENDDGRETLLGMIDAYAEARLLRQSAFLRMSSQGGPVTTKGKTRGLLQAWGSFFDREMRAAERLGLERRQKETLADWFADAEADERAEAEREQEQTNEHESSESDNDGSNRATGGDSGGERGD